MPNAFDPVPSRKVKQVKTGILSEHVPLVVPLLLSMKLLSSLNKLATILESWNINWEDYALKNNLECHQLPSRYLIYIWYQMVLNFLYTSLMVYLLVDLFGRRLLACVYHTCQSGLNSPRSFLLDRQPSYHYKEVDNVDEAIKWVCHAYEWV